MTSRPSMYENQHSPELFPRKATLHSSESTGSADSANSNAATAIGDLRARPPTSQPPNNQSPRLPPAIGTDAQNDYDHYGGRKASGVGHLPPAFVERGEVSSRTEMTTPYSNEQWAKIIQDTEIALSVDEKQQYAVAPDIAKTIDHTLLKLDATKEQIEELCDEAKKDNFATVCVRPEWVALCADRLLGTSIHVASVIGFHEGTYDLSHKLHETKASVAAGAGELDIVLNYPDLIARRYEKVHDELATLRSAAPRPVRLKLIFETSQLDRVQIIAASVLASFADFDFVKTSTGFNGRGASVEDVRVMRACCERLAVGDRKMRVKASGGVRTVDDAVKMLAAGASRLGASAGVAIARQARERAAGEKVRGGAIEDDTAY